MRNSQLHRRYSKWESAETVYLGKSDWEKFHGVELKILPGFSDLGWTWMPIPCNHDYDSGGLGNPGAHHLSTGKQTRHGQT